MESSLVFVTLASLAMAASLSVVVWRLLRDERHRSDARVAALSRMAAGPIAQAPPKRVDPLDLPLNPEPRPASRLAPPASVIAPPASHLAPPASRLAPPVSRLAPRAALIVALALGVTAVVLFALTIRTRSAAAQQVSTAAPAEPALELLALQDTRDGDTLTISGTVRNPRGAALLKRATVTAITFDGSGAYLATGRALIDVTSLAPGDASSFVVTVTPAGNVARYRIAFRAQDGRVIAHTDRRQSGPVADTTAAALDVRGTP